MASRKHTVDRTPRARSERILVEEVADEAVIYDLDTSVAHALKPLAAAVFANADGARDLDQIAGLCSDQLGSVVTEADVAEALTQLDALDLLEQTGRDGVSRRDAIKVFAAAGAGSMLISSIAAPAALAGQLPNVCQTGSTTPNPNPWGHPSNPQPSSCVTVNGNKCWQPSPSACHPQQPSSTECWNNQSGCLTGPNCNTGPIKYNGTCTYTDSSGKCHNTGKWQCLPVNCGTKSESASHCQVVCVPSNISGGCDWGQGCSSGYNTPTCYTSGVTTGCWGVYCQGNP